MKILIENLVTKYEAGRFSRREFVGYLTALFAVLSGPTAPAQESSKSTFEALDINHLAINVPDVEKAEDFYQKHFGLRTFHKFPDIRFMGFGTNFIAFFKDQKPGIDHFCFTLEKYDQQEAVKKLRENSIEPIIEDERTYLYDPNGIKIQITHDDHPGGRPKMTEELLKKIY
jgi:catechol 2,3-dioxygenase-like lactoylglutathione lyase family enzyme